MVYIAHPYFSLDLLADIPNVFRTSFLTHSLPHHTTSSTFRLRFSFITYTYLFTCHHTLETVVSLICVHASLDKHSWSVCFWVLLMSWYLGAEFLLTLFIYKFIFWRYLYQATLWFLTLANSILPS